MTKRRIRIVREPVKPVLRPLFLYLGSAVLFLVITIWLTWPLATNFSSAIISQPDFTDGPFFIWNLWWVKKSILNFSNPFFSDFVYYPSKSNLALHTLTFTSGLIYLPLSIFFRALTSLNIIQFLSFISTGIGMIILLNYITKPKTILEQLSAIVSSVIFSFSPFVFSHLLAGHYNLSMIWPIPFLIYFFLKSTEEVDHLSALALGLMACALAYLDLQLIFFTGIICLPILIGNIISKKSEFFRKKILTNFALAALVFALVFALPYGYLMKEFWGSKDSFLTYNNGDLKMLFGPNPLNPLFGFKNYKLVTDLIGSYRENIISLSFISLGLAILGTLLFFKQFAKEKIIFYSILVIGVLLTLGPNLQVSGIVYGIKLPYFYLQHLPFFNLGLVPSRFIIIVYFALAVLAGLALFSTIRFLENKRMVLPAILLTLILPGFILLENYSGQMMLDPLYDIKEIKSIANSTENFTILPYNAGQRDAYLQTLHEKKVVTGFLGRRIHDYYLFKYSDVYPINKFSRGFVNELDLTDSKAKIKPIFEKYKIKYVLVEKYFKNEDELNKLNEYLGKIEAKLVFESEKVILYQVD